MVGMGNWFPLGLRGLPGRTVTRAAKSEAQSAEKPASIFAQPDRCKEAGGMTHSPSVVLDTNATLDWLVFRDKAATVLGTAIEDRQLIWLATPAMRQEFDEVLSRAALAPWRSQERDAAAAWQKLARMSEGEPLPGPLRCRDPDDQVFIDMALQWRSAWLITRDRALLALALRAHAWGLNIATPMEFSSDPKVLALTHVSLKT
jgi:putative PIN family toxin of toxin-antitoxin system